MGEQDRGQAFTTEAIIAAALIVIVFVFVAPNFIHPTTESDIEEIQEDRALESELDSLVTQYAENGELKAAILNYDLAAGNWENAFPTHYEDAEELTDAQYQAFGEALVEFEEEHDIRISVHLIPHSQERIHFIEPFGETPPDQRVGTTTTVTLYQSDRLQSEPGAHSQLGTSTPHTKSDGQKLGDLALGDYPIQDIDEDADIYNTVTVQVIASPDILN